MQLLEAFSEQAAFINSVVIPWVLRLVMVGLGLSLTIPDFKRVIVFPKAAAIGLTAQLIGLPVAAFALATLFGAPPAIAVGLVILAACPSGVTSNAYTFASKADVPLSVTLTAITSVVTVFTIPFLLGLALDLFNDPGQAVQPSALNMLLNLVTVTLVPLVIGMLIRAWFSAFALAAVEPIRKGVLYLMIAVLVLGVASSYQEIIDYYRTAGLLVITMNLLTMALGYGAARLFQLPTPQVITITFEVGVQNLALAFAITFNMLNRPELAVTGLIYAVVMPATALIFIGIARRLLAADPDAVAA